MGACAEVVEFWDHEIARWVSGDHTLTPELQQWRDAYRGRGQGLVDLSVVPEPYIGSLGGETPKLVMLGLNPGAAQPEFQSMEGVFTKQIRSSSYNEWAATAPYGGGAWESSKGTNIYLRNRLAFARRLNDEDQIVASQLLFMELYPFHSARVTASMVPPAHLLEKFVFSPLAEVEIEYIFAFGKPWQGVARRLNLGIGQVLSVDWKTASREARLYPLRSGQNLIVMSQLGYAGPPGIEDTEALRRALNV